MLILCCKSKVDVGNEVLDIVGASNVKEGMDVIVANRWCNITW